MSEKLVRDNIPVIIAATGALPRTRLAGPAEYRALLELKLAEETAEFCASGDAEELADILEVVYALAAVLGMSRAALEGLRRAKAAERGGFGGRVVWMGNGPSPS